jgi:hypothetical protein
MTDTSTDGIPLPLDAEEDPDAMVPVAGSLLLRQSPVSLRRRVHPEYTGRVPDLWKMTLTPGTPMPVRLLGTGRGALSGIDTKCPAGASESRHMKGRRSGEVGAAARYGSTSGSDETLHTVRRYAPER